MRAIAISIFAVAFWLRRTQFLGEGTARRAAAVSMTREVSLSNDQRFPNGVAHRRRMVTLKQVAEMLNVNERHVRRLVFERRIPYFKWGHLLRFDPVELEQWLEQARVAPDSQQRPLPGRGRRTA